jgi:hypothetical protein
MANILRGLNATLTSTNNMQNDATEMGEQLFYAPSVFSYFSPQYRTEKGLLGPEFQIYSTQTVADRADIVNSVLYGKLDSTTTVDLTPFVNQAGNTTNLLNYIGLRFSARRHVDGTRAGCDHRGQCRHHAHREGTGGAVRRSHLG